VSKGNSATGLPAGLLSHRKVRYAYAKVMARRIIFLQRIRLRQGYDVTGKDGFYLITTPGRRQNQRNQLCHVERSGVEISGICGASPVGSVKPAAELYSTGRAGGRNGRNSACPVE